MFEHSAKGLKTEFVVGFRHGYKLKSTESDRFVSLISVTKCRYKLRDNNYRASVSFEGKKSCGGSRGKGNEWLSRFYSSPPIGILKLIASQNSPNTTLQSKFTLNSLNLPRYSPPMDQTNEIVS